MNFDNVGAWPAFVRLHAVVRTLPARNHVVVQRLAIALVVGLTPGNPSRIIFKLEPATRNSEMNYELRCVKQWRRQGLEK